MDYLQLILTKNDNTIEELSPGVREQWLGDSFWNAWL